jgi:hypothetical protein
VSWLLSLALKLFGSGLLDKLIGALRQRASAELEREKAAIGGDTQIAIARLQAEIEAQKAKALIRAEEGRWGLTAIAGIVLFALPTGLHYWAVVLDSVCGIWSGVACVGAWRIAALPGPFAGIESQIILSFFITGGAVTIARLFARR